MRALAHRMNDIKLNTLILNRFCGEEYYSIQSASWSIWDGRTLCVEMWFEEGLNLHEDTDYLAQEPGWELYFDVPSITDEMLKPGMILGDTENIEDETHFYYCEHLPTYNNKLEILGREDDKILFKITGECCDVNYYDGSKGSDTLEITAWIDEEN